MNGLQNFAGFLETFELGEESSNSTCSETSNIAEDKQLILVREPIITAWMEQLYREPSFQWRALEQLLETC